MRRLAILAVLTLPLAGCLLSASSKTEKTGSPVSQATLDQIEPGASKGFVQALIGDPTTKSEVEGGREVWKWEYREQKTSRGAVFLILASSSTTEKSGTVYVVFRDGVVERTWRD